MTYVRTQDRDMLVNLATCVAIEIDQNIDGSFVVTAENADSTFIELAAGLTREEADAYLAVLAVITSAIDLAPAVAGPAEEAAL